MLPNLSYPTIQIEQPSTKKKIKFRPYLVKEEKILLMAKESGELDDIYEAVTQIVEACCQDTKINIRKMPLFDLEILFLRLRSFSVSNIEKFSGIDSEDQSEQQFLVNFDEIQVTFPEDKISNKIEVNKTITILMRYPAANIYLDEDLMSVLKTDQKNAIYELVLDCVENVFDGDAKLTFTPEELKEWVGSLPTKVHRKMVDFLTNMPSIEYVLEYKNTLGNDRKWVFRSLLDFFPYL